MAEASPSTAKATPTVSESRVLPQYRDWREGETDARGKKYKALPGKRHFHLWELQKVDRLQVTMKCVACLDSVILNGLQSA